jgi:hypothetical protein
MVFSGMALEARPAHQAEPCIGSLAGFGNGLVEPGSRLADSKNIYKLQYLM